MNSYSSADTANAWPSNCRRPVVLFTLVKVAQFVFNNIA